LGTKRNGALIEFAARQYCGGTFSSIAPCTTLNNGLWGLRRLGYRDILLDSKSVEYFND